METISCQVIILTSKNYKNNLYKLESHTSSLITILLYLYTKYCRVKINHKSHALRDNDYWRITTIAIAYTQNRKMRLEKWSSVKFFIEYMYDYDDDKLNIILSRLKPN